MSLSQNPARIAIVMGSKSDWATMQHAAEILDALDVPHHVEVVSAHRTPDKLFSFAETAQDNGYQVIIAGAGGAAHLVLGGPGGVEVDVETGDVILLPAGTGHRRLSATDDFLVVGGYPPGTEADLCRQAATPDMLARIAALPYPEQDPVNGLTPALTALWY